MLIVVFISILYFSLIFSFILGWFRLDNNINKSSNEVEISVVIAVRNEENSICKILSDIARQKYSKEKHEVIIVDDNSVDDTYKIVEDFCKIKSNFKILQIKNKFGKKEALQKGIRKAKGKLIVTTDADCRVGELWLKSISDFYLSTNAKMIIAPVVYQTDKKLVSFANFQALEFMSLIASTAGATGINSPIMCNGANLIFEKKIFFELENPLKTELATGDDVFLMLNIKKKYQRQIKFLKNRNALVYTESSKNFKSFVNQRIRWASKSFYYSDFFVNFVGIIVFLANFTLFITLFGAIFQLLSWKLFFVLFLFKFLADFPLLFIVTKYFSKLSLLFLMIPLQFFYFFYVVMISFFTLFVKYKWKK